MNSLIRLLALLALGYTLTTLLLSGQIAYYINPRFIPLTKFSLVFLYLLCFVTFLDFAATLRHWGVGKRFPKAASVLVLFAFLTPLAFPPKMLDSSMAEQKGMMVNQQRFNGEKSKPGREEVENPIDGEANPQPTAPPFEGGQMAANPGETGETGVVFLTRVNYLETLFDIFDHSEKYRGKEIEADGFIMRHTSLGPNRYMVARYAIACCAADAVTVGFVIEGTAPYPDNTWVKMRGKLIKLEENQPIVKVTTLEEIPLPPDPYVYQYD